MIPENVDCIILGTGLTNSILAAACSRIGKSVLHVDQNNYYGNEWASFTFQQLIDWIKLTKHEDVCLDSIPEELISKSRMFCIDLCPRLLYSNGAMVELLVESNVSRYHEFKNNIRILSMVKDEIHIMPCRRSDVFTSPLLTDLIDKRRLMKFIELCIKYEPDQDTPETKEITMNANRPISEFLNEKGLKFTLREYIINSIAMVKPDESTKMACENIKRFMIATERFGRSPFIFPLYGCGEFPQSFCRLSAVFGGIYCLNTKIDTLKIGMVPLNTNDESTYTNEIGLDCDKDKFKVKFSNNQYEVKSDFLVMEHNSVEELNLKKPPGDYVRVSRAILITNKSVVPNNENLLSFLRIPSSQSNSDTIYLIEFNSSVMVCPQGLNIVYLWTKSSSDSAKEDLEPIVNRVYSNETDAILWKFYYHQITCSPATSTGIDQTESLYITKPPCDDIDYDSNIKEAKRIFHQMFPDQEFLPRAPDPDEIVT